MTYGIQIYLTQGSTVRSYLGKRYKNGYYLHRYILETPEEYDARVRHTPDTITVKT